MNSQLFSPISLRGLEIRNRVFVSPMCQYSSDDGAPNEWHMVHLGSRAVGGAGLVMSEAAAVLQRTAEFLLAYPEALILIEGHCDEVGTDDYNLRLGTRRAEAARDHLVSLGVSPERLQTVSVGKQQPFCTESSDEPCRQLNRRAHFVLVP